MDKKTIKFLMKNGFTLDEIAEMEPETQEPEPEPEIEQTNTNNDKEAENKEKSFEKLLSDFRTELSQLREQIHRDNRIKTAIEPEEPKQLSFEEDIEKMIEEVTK